MKRKLLALITAAALALAALPAVAVSYDELLEKSSGYAAAGDNERAFACLELAIRLDPARLDAYLSAASLSLTAGDLEKANDMIVRALGVDPVSPGTWRLRCLLDAASVAPDAYETDRIYADICGAVLTASDYAAIGAMYVSAGQYEKAVDVFRSTRPEDLSEAQKTAYWRALMATGQRAEAEALDLVPVSARDAALEAAFHQDALRLVPADLPPISADQFVFTEEMLAALNTDSGTSLQEQLPEITAALHKALSNGYRLLSRSPNGLSALVQVDNAVCGYYDGKYRPLYSSESRGVPDTHGNLRTYFVDYLSSRTSSLITDEGVLYSPDGRYAAILNRHLTVSQLRLIIDPILIDLKTGEVFLTATYGNRLVRNDEYISGAVTSAVFSADGRWFWYVMLGNWSEYRFALYRYNLDTGETEFCCPIPYMAYYPKLCELQDGSLLALSDQADSSSPMGVFRLSRVDGEWSAAEYPLEWPTRLMYSNLLQYSAESGCAFLRDTRDTMPLVIFRPDESFDGLRTCYAIDPEKDSLVALNYDDYLQTFDSDHVSSAPYVKNVLAVLSPDGHYALSVTADCLYMIDLDTLAVRRVTTDLDIASVTASYNRLYMEWNGDLLIFRTADGATTVWRFEY